MKLKAAVIAAGVLYAGPGLCAESSASQGSAHSLTFFIINFLIFVALVVYFAAPMGRGFFARRSSSLMGSFRRAEEALSRAETAAAQARQQLAGIEQQKTRLAASIQEETAYILRKIAETAEATVSRITRDAAQSAAAAIEVARQSFRERLVSAALLTARETIVSQLERADQERLLQNFATRIAGEARA